jgi:bla regulator protein BlaR1
MMLPQGVLVAVDVLGVVLLHFLWQGAVLGLIYAGLKPLCTSASARYRLGMLAMATLAAAPLVTAIWCWPSDSAAPGKSAPLLAATLQVGQQVISSWQLKSLLPWLVGAWLFGVVVIAAHSVWQWRRLMRVVQRADAAAAEWQSRLQRLCERFDVRRPVRLLYSAAATTPMLLGWIKPVILLPASMLSGFTPHQVELIIAHELGHIRRFDYLVNLVQVAIETVLFYHPVVHWISRDVRNAREACCDDLVLELAQGNRLAYARALAELEELRLTAPALGAAGGALLSRIKRIVGEPEKAEPLPRSYALPLVLVCAAMLSLIWRQQHTAADLEAGLSRISAQALALLSATSLQIERPSLALNLPLPQVQPIRTNVAIPVVSAPIVATSARMAEVSAPIEPVQAEPIVSAPAAPIPTAVEVPTPAVAVPKSSPLHVVAPVYPPQAMVAGIEGAVELEYLIKADGSVGQIRIVHARPGNVFDDAAKAALRGWVFPASSAGERRTQNFAFSLHGSSHTEEQCQAPTGSLICRRPTP